MVNFIKTPKIGLRIMLDLMCPTVIISDFYTVFVAQIKDCPLFI